ncbi:Stk1 family PASTA domain-containing Ser/Thr kinase [Paenibacillus hodogayensis]|uniref:non-specific serine/threonine protein kinase n=1 Tax=Paenibacillus hodogayensis TaxID=279208 RepID=A0ABV5VPK9_9BACL
MIGHVLGGRYEILDRIGGGGMALVYKGQDILLNRKVAVKVLRQQYVHDEEFIRRFRREAQAAASLSHPNVVSIYDVGQEDEIHYIVMEYVEGKTLNDLIKERAPLPAEEAVRIAGQICDALDHAHLNQIIHRDIKPHNILIGKNGRVKVTDFGIARAADASQITQTGSVVGSVHYFSPEHAKGTLTGAQSDLYSLGIVLYQMLTGRLPFLGESPISVALKHLQEDVEEPRKVNPLIPQSVENVILKSMRKKPEERYRSAKEMLQDLDTCLQPDRRNEPKLLFPSDDYDDTEKTRVLPAIRGDYVPVADDEDEIEDAGTRKRKGKAWVKPLLWTVVIVALLGLMYLGVRYVKQIIEVPEVDVPNVVNWPVEEAEKKLQALNLSVKIVPQTNAQVAKDIVIQQDPTPVRVKVNNAVTLYVSLGPEKQRMPDWKGKQVNDVLNTELIRFGIDKSQIKQVPTFGNEDAGTIIAQSPAADEEYDPKTVSIQLTVSKGKEQVTMPDLTGMTEVEAQSRAKLNDFKLTVQREATYKGPKGQIYDQFPYKSGELVSPGAEIKVFVSTGYPANAKEVTASKVIEPAEKGKESTVEIIYSDARGDDIKGTTRKIKDAQTFEVQLVLSPEKDGSITYKVDGKRLDVDTIPYDEKKSVNPPAGGSGGAGNTGGQQTGSPPGTNGSTGTGANAPGGTGTNGTTGTNAGAGANGGAGGTNVAKPPASGTQPAGTKTVTTPPTGGRN